MIILKIPLSENSSSYLGGAELLYQELYDPGQKDRKIAPTHKNASSIFTNQTLPIY